MKKYLDKYLVGALAMALIISAIAATITQITMVNGVCTQLIRFSNVANVYYGNGSALTGISGGSGDTVAPATNTDSFVPQWNGANSKTLKDGLAVGTAASNLVQLDGSAKLPAIDGSQLTNLPSSSITWAALMAAKTATSNYSADHTVTTGEDGTTFSNYVSAANAFGAHAALAEYSGDIVAYWGMNEASGDRYDMKGLYVATDVNTATSATGKNGLATLTASSGSRYLKVADTQVDLPALFESDQFSVSFWVKFDDSNVWEAIFAAQDAASENGFVIGKNLPDAGKIKIVCYDGNVTTVSFESAAIYNDGNWHHVVFAMEGGNAEAWIDGVSFGTIPNVHYPAIGANCANDVYSGYCDATIDELVFWDEGIGVNAVTALYNAGNGRYYATPITFSLPAKADKLEYSFLVELPVDVYIDPNGTDRIFDLTNAGGDKIYAFLVGSSVRVRSTAQGWISLGGNGTWSDGN